jgi:hypothetical protein
MEITLNLFLAGHTVVFRRTYNTHTDCEAAALVYTGKLHQKLTKQFGQGSFEGSINITGTDAIILYKCMLVEFDPHKYSKPIDVYKIA